MALLNPSPSVTGTASSTSTPPLPRPSSLLLAVLRPLYPALEVAHRLALNTLAISLLACTLPFSLYLTYGQTERIARGQGVWGARAKELSGLLWEGFDWLEECEDEGVLRGWVERVLGGEDNLTEGSLKRRRHESSYDDGPSSGSDSFAIAAARRDSGIEILD